MMSKSEKGEAVRSYFLKMEEAAIKAASKPGRKRLAHQDAPLFVAADVCAILELGQVTNTLARLDEDERTLN